MKRNNLTTAVLAGIAGIAGIAGSAQAVNINPDGLGQVLIYPYYTTNNGNSTLVSVVNTTDAAKAVKVRFLESLNSREVLDFNLYMSAYDVWTAAIFDNAGAPTLLTADSTCTVPYFYGNGNGLGAQPFLNFAYSGTNADANPARESITRASEGHFEMIEMGEMTGIAAIAATHDQLASPVVPADCQRLVNRWSNINGVDGVWLVDNTIDITAATGGLFGGAAIINGQEGTMYTYEAKAMNGFWDAAVPAGVRHSNPGDELPSLVSGGDVTANLFNDQGAAVQLTYANSIEAVSAMFMHDTLMNEYAIPKILAAQSEWTLTFPTKRFYTDPAFTFTGTVPVAPFTMPRDNFATACEDLQVEFWDREEGQVTPPPPGSDGPIVSPPPPPAPDPDVVLFEVCAETNVIRFDGEEGGPTPKGAQVPATPIVGTNGFDSLTIFNLPLGFNSGWARIDLPFNVDANGNPLTPRVDSQGLSGLPVVGYWFEGFTNGTLQGGSVLANYGGIFEHKGTRAQVAPQ